MIPCIESILSCATEGEKKKKKKLDGLAAENKSFKKCTGYRVYCKRQREFWRDINVLHERKKNIKQLRWLAAWKATSKVYVWKHCYMARTSTRKKYCHVATALIEYNVACSSLFGHTYNALHSFAPFEQRNSTFKLLCSFACKHPFLFRFMLLKIEKAPYSKHIHLKFRLFFFLSFLFARDGGRECLKSRNALM